VRPTAVFYAAILASMAGSACKTLKPVSLDQIGSLRPGRVWITDSSQGSAPLVVNNPQFVNDTLVGFAGGTYQEIPRSHISGAKVQEPATGRTVLLVVGLTAAVGGFAYAITSSGGNQINNAQAGDCDKHPEAAGCNGN